MADELDDNSNPDRDGDGVPNELDGCPDNPAKVAPGVCGCDQNDFGDSDGDGVLDCVDECPVVAAGPNGSNTGCPPAEPVFESPDDVDQIQPPVSQPSSQSDCSCGAGAVPLAPLSLLGFLGVRSRMRRRRVKG